MKKTNWVAVRIIAVCSAIAGGLLVAAIGMFVVPMIFGTPVGGGGEGGGLPVAGFIAIALAIGIYEMVVKRLGK